jgi:hypothetical protein
MIHRKKSDQIQPAGIRNGVAMFFGEVGTEFMNNNKWTWRYKRLSRYRAVNARIFPVWVAFGRPGTQLISVKRWWKQINDVSWHSEWINLISWHCINLISSRHLLRINDEALGMAACKAMRSRCCAERSTRELSWAYKFCLGFQRGLKKRKRPKEDWERGRTKQVTTKRKENWRRKRK